MAPGVQATTAPTMRLSPKQLDQNGTVAIVTSGETSIATLCASCDLCRSRKTKCDGAFPCSTCVGRYKKKHHLNESSGLEGVPLSDFNCVYSPAKRRGPVPRRVAQPRASNEIGQPHSATIRGTMNAGDSLMLDQLGSFVTGKGQQQSWEGLLTSVTPEHQELLLQQEQQHSIPFHGVSLEQSGRAQNQSPNDGSSMASQYPPAMHFDAIDSNYVNADQGPASQRPRKLMDVVGSGMNSGEQKGFKGTRLPKAVALHLPLIEKGNLDGKRLRAYFCLSVDDLFRLPPIPTEEEYCARLPVPINPALLPSFEVAALRAGRFAEIALGALASDQTSLALELSNATVECLRDCVEQPVQESCMYDIARAYILLGIFRSFRGDMVRYFKYRRVCLMHLSHLDHVPGIEALLAAISFHDSWVYMIHNAVEDALPDIDEAIPPLLYSSRSSESSNSSTTTSRIVSNPSNKNWIQGPPQIFLNNEAPPLSRSLDALACAIRSCCDQANSKFGGMIKSAGVSDSSCGMGVTPTMVAVMANSDELCSRNMVQSALALLRQHQSSPSGLSKNRGHHLVVSCMDAFLGVGDETKPGGFSDSQIQSLIGVCNTIIEYPILLFQGGPTYHMVTNAAILLCHVLNGIYANRDKKGEDPQSAMQDALFEEISDCCIAVRKLLNAHGKKLPPHLRCHKIPRPSFSLINRRNEQTDDSLFIDLGETLMCQCIGCQGFVLMACSPCVAAERAIAASRMQGTRAVQEEENEDVSELYNEFDLSDDMLLEVLSRIISS